MYTAGHVSNTNSIMSSKKQFILFFLATPGYSVVQVFVSGCGSSAGRGTAFAPPDIQSLSLAIGFSQSVHFVQNHIWIYFTFVGQMNHPNKETRRVAKVLGRDGCW